MYWSAWDPVKACHLRCQAFTRSHADTLYHLGKTNTDSAAVLNLKDLENKLRSELKTVDRKRAPIGDILLIGLVVESDPGHPLSMLCCQAVAAGSSGTDTGLFKS